MIQWIVDKLAPIDASKYVTPLPSLPEDLRVKESQKMNVQEAPKTHITSVLIDPEHDVFEFALNNVNLRAELTSDEKKALLSNSKTKDFDKARRLKPYIHKSRSEVVALFKGEKGYSDGSIGPYLAILRKQSVQNCAVGASTQ